MSPYVHPSPDIDQHPRDISVTIPKSPSVSTVVSSDTINTIPSGLSSEILRGSTSSPSSGLPDESTNTKSSQSTQPGPFTQHKRFFFEDGNITFLVRLPSRRNTCALLISRVQVDGILYRVHRYFFCRDSKVFMTRLSRLPAQEGSSPPIISLENVKSKDLDAFLSVLYPLCVLWPSNISCNCVIDISSIVCSEISTHWRNTRLKSYHLFWTYPPGGVSPLSATWPSAVWSLRHPTSD